MNFEKLGQVFDPRESNLPKWWNSHTMAPTAININNEFIRVFIGAWDKEGISRITYLDLDPSNPLNILNVCKEPVLNIGEDGMFDENGVFPAHAYFHENQVYLYYTGFQKGHKIRHYNFGGLARGGLNDNEYQRVSKAPVLDRKDEGLLVRAGQSIFWENGAFKTVYSAGSSWVLAGGKTRPTYDVYYQESQDGISYKDCGEKIISANHSVEHGLGRPQIIKLRGRYYCFYTRRILSMKYFFGVSVSDDLLTWNKLDDEIFGIEHSENGFDSEMIYFPSVVEINDKIYLFYCGNNFGETGLGCAKITSL